MHNSINAFQGNCGVSTNEDNEKRQKKHSETTRCVVGYIIKNIRSPHKHQIWNHQVQNRDTNDRE